MFAAINPAVTIIVRAAEVIQIAGFCLALPMVNPAALGGKSDFSPGRTPYVRRKKKALANLR
jgi:hypothetical protein